MIVVIEGYCSYRKTVLKCHSTNLACFFILEYNLHLVGFFCERKRAAEPSAGWPEFDPGFFSLCISYLIIKDTTALLRASQTKQEPRLIRKQIKSKTIRQPSF